MLPFEIRRFVARTGREVAILVDRKDGPLFWPNVYVTSDYLKLSRSANTCVKVLRSIAMARMWASAVGRDLDHELREGSFVSVGDVEAIADFLRLSAADQETTVLLTAAGSNKPRRVVRLENMRPNPLRLATPQQQAVHPAEAAARIRWVASYIEWHLSQRLGTLDRKTQDSDLLRYVGEKAIGRLRQLVPRVSSHRDDEPALEGVPLDMLLRIEEAMRPAPATHLNKASCSSGTI
jgi:hypothetical protein